MAEASERYEKNVEGRYYVDYSCIYCDLCREIAPTVFAEDKEDGIAFVFKQPETDDEHELAKEALEACPTESIGDLENPGKEKIYDGSQEFSGDSSRKWWQIWKS